MRMRSLLSASLGATLLLTAFAPAAAAQPERETICDDGIDNDGDGLTDCADSDCADHPACQPDGEPENTEERCSDWIDNDGDGSIDCEDYDCRNMEVCKGSWDLMVEQHQRGEAPALPGYDNSDDGRAVNLASSRDMSRLIGETSSDGTGMRFSVVSHITQSYNFDTEEADTRFSTLQLRAFGSIPFIQDSFFLVSMRAERTPRLTFAMFQIPIGNGHYLNINSGGGGLSTSLIRSASKQLLIDSPYYLYNAFEQSNGAAIEVGGGLDDRGMFNYRVFAAGGSGRGNGNVGGRYFTFDNTNYTWSLGAQLMVNLMGHMTRWDTPMLYTPEPTAMALTVGFKYDQRAQERYPAANVNFTARSGRFIGSAETYLKHELNFVSTQIAWNVALGYLIWPQNFLLAADIGQYLPGEMQEAPDRAETDIRRQLHEFQWRVGLHWYFWRNIGVLSAVYSDRTVSNQDPAEPNIQERILKVVGQYRF